MGADNSILNNKNIHGWIWNASYILRLSRTGSDPKQLLIVKALRDRVWSGRPPFFKGSWGPGSLWNIPLFVRLSASHLEYLLVLKALRDQSWTPPFLWLFDSNWKHLLVFSALRIRSWTFPGFSDSPSPIRITSYFFLCGKFVLEDSSQAYHWPTQITWQASHITEVIFLVKGVRVGTERRRRANETRPLK